MDWDSAQRSGRGGFAGSSHGEPEWCAARRLLALALVVEGVDRATRPARLFERHSHHLDGRDPRFMRFRSCGFGHAVSVMRFLRLNPGVASPDAKTIWLFRARDPAGKVQIDDSFQEAQGQADG